MKKAILVAVLLAAGCKSNEQTKAEPHAAPNPAPQVEDPQWSWNGLKLGMSYDAAAPVVQKLCGANETVPLVPDNHFKTSYLRCRAVETFAGQRVQIQLTIFDNNVLAVEFKPFGPRDDQWEHEVAEALDSKYGQGVDYFPDGSFKAWETDGELWIYRTSETNFTFISRKALSARDDAEKPAKAARLLGIQKDL